MFAEVILPLPLYTTYTYAIPADMEGMLNVGSRVLVQFGKRKFYTGIVSAIHTNQPQGYEVKEISSLLDAQPIIRYPQLKFWEWIASYYLCSVGDVFKAALPTGLKPESETIVRLTPDADEDMIGEMTDKERILFEYLKEEKKATLSDLETKTKIKNVTSLLHPFLETGLIEVNEKVNERYRPKTERYIRLTIQPGDNDALHNFFNLTTRSRKQEQTLIAYLDLSRFMNSATPNEVSREALLAKSGANPGILKAMIDKGIFEEYKKTINRYADLSTETLPLSPLSPAQQNAYKEILENFKDNNICLLHGVTGSGKTEIYTYLIQRVLDRGNQVLFLVPEISLTTQLTDRLRKVFGDRMLVYHSRFSDNERVDIWKRLLHSNEPLLILGVRSSIFLPFARLGLIIVDEEHESSYKQYDPAPRYNARDAALVLASLHGAPTLLGSATPAVETYYKAQSGKYALTTLTERFSGATLPDVEIVDMKDQRKRKVTKGILSQPLQLATKEALEHKRQALMFQNRRGFAPFVVCKNCGWTPKCVNCDVSLVYHKFSDLLRCHYCGYAMPLPNVCPACGENAVEVYGYGTERIAEEVHEAFDRYSVRRMDLDTTRNKDSYQEIIEDFSAHNTDILVGTQMVTKGLDFGKVTVVGVLNADSLLNFPDFRSNERAFNMLEQVAGRAGRRQDKGTVFIQTTDPENPVLDYVKRHDYSGYYTAEIASRERLGYPPFSRIVCIMLKNKDANTVDQAALLYAQALRQVFGNRVLGPEKPFVSRVATYFLQSIMLKIEASASMTKVKHILRTIYESLARDPRIKSSIVYYDVDPA